MSALAQVGRISVCAFGGQAPQIVVPLVSEVGSEDGAHIAGAFTFMEEAKHGHDCAVADLLKLTVDLLETDNGGGSEGSISMILILSDGRFNKEHTRKWVHVALSRGFIPLLLIIDNATAAIPDRVQGASTGRDVSAGADRSPGVLAKEKTMRSTSICDMKQVVQVGKNIRVTPYLENFPFPFYAIVQDLQLLPTILGDVVRQWVEATASQW